MKPEEILDQIEILFPNAKCELLHETPFQLLVAVVLSAQTTDAGVNRVTPTLFSRWPDSASLAKADVQEVADTIRSIGLYPTKSKNIVALAQKIEEEFHGEVPSTFKELQSLPGVGRKTANVVRSVAFDIPSMAVDTHVERVSKRLGLAKFDDDPLKVEEKLRRKLPRERWNQAHHDLIFFGRYFCTARFPKCEKCPFASFCKREKFDLYKAQKIDPDFVAKGVRPKRKASK
ncbi:endonuclease III [uncultured Allobaculum sp.]|uniref:endonuclease III n=1 Tax=Allobaculum sp. TaxID=1872463 RepID=UPI0025893846|nr:endonuclease III [uncultured Allobaculum sp.]